MLAVVGTQRIPCTPRLLLPAPADRASVSLGGCTYCLRCVAAPQPISSVWHSTTPHPSCLAATLAAPGWIWWLRPAAAALAWTPPTCTPSAPSASGEGSPLSEICVWLLCAASAQPASLRSVA